MTIKQRQNLLSYLGYYVGDVDGIWGTLSKTATKAFQKDFGLTPDGVCGDDTEKALKHTVCFGIAKKVETKDVADNNVGDITGTFWDEIEFFTREEFRCKCGGKYCNGFPEEPDQTLVELVDDLRADAGRPAHPSSGLRCETWNRIQGGVADSRHRKGKALDFYIEGLSGSQLLSRAQADSRTRYAYIIDGQWVHVDVN